MTMPCHFCKWIFFAVATPCKPLGRYAQNNKVPQKFPRSSKKIQNFPPQNKIFPKKQNLPKNSKNSQKHKTHTQKPKKSPQTPAKYNSNYNFPPKSPKKFPSHQSKIPQKFVKNKKIPLVQKLYIIIYAKIFTLRIKEFMDFSPFYKRLKMTKSPKNSPKFFPQTKISQKISQILQKFTNLSLV